MSKALRIVEIAWIVVGVISLIEIVRLWGTFDSKFWLFVGCVGVSAFMFFLRKRQRERYEQNMKNKSSEE